MTTSLVGRDVQIVAWLLALAAALAFFASITGDGDGVAGVARLQGWAWAWLVVLLLLVGWAGVLVKARGT